MCAVNKLPQMTHLCTLFYFILTYPFRNTSGLMQHHDAITGTSFPGCYGDYNKQLNSAQDGLRRLIPTLQVCLCQQLRAVTACNTVWTSSWAYGIYRQSECWVSMVLTPSPFVSLVFTTVSWPICPVQTTRSGVHPCSIQQHVMNV